MKSMVFGGLYVCGVCVGLILIATFFMINAKGIEPSTKNGELRLKELYPYEYGEGTWRMDMFGLDSEGRVWQHSPRFKEWTPLPMNIGIDRRKS